MTPDEQEQQRRGFAFGNASISNTKITREMVDDLAEIKPLDWSEVDQNAVDAIEYARAIAMNYES